MKLLPLQVLELILQRQDFDNFQQVGVYLTYVFNGLIEWCKPDLVIQQAYHFTFSAWQ